MMTTAAQDKSSLSSSLWHGLGLFGESYLLFSIGTLRPIWSQLYPSCFNEQDYTQCQHPYLNYKSITYSVVVAVMIGMILLGIAANNIGRRKGSIITASFMSFGSLCLTLSTMLLSNNANILFPVMSISLFIFGIGVGGEYPLSATLASERAMAQMKSRMERENNEDVYVERRMNRLLFRNNDKKKEKVIEEPPDCLTPRRGNIATQNNDTEKDGGKLTSLLQGGVTISSTNTTPWQTLDAIKTTTSSNNSKNIHNLSINTSHKDLTPMTESYYSAEHTNSILHLSPTKETLNSLSTYNTNTRKRGRDVLLVFSMQGLGIFANSSMITVLLLMFRQRSYDGGEADNEDGDNSNIYYYTNTSLLNIWRLTYAVGTAILFYVLISRIFYLTESEVWTQDVKQREEERIEKYHRESGVGFQPPPLAQQQQQISGVDDGQEDPVISPTMSSITMKSEFNTLGSTNIDGCRVLPAILTASTEDVSTSRFSTMILLLRHYGVRLFGTSMTWLLWDIAFYGNKLFQSSFIIALAGEDASLIHITSASTLNAFIALLGYYAAAAIIDDPDVGRLSLQQIGFLITGTLFLLCGYLNDTISSTWLVIMYFGSSFFGQCGPNSTTFLISAEVFPTNMRAMCHGISASAGKAGALIASILFNFVGEKDLFLYSGYASFAASFITFLTIPETTTLDLYEIDKQWHKILCDQRYEGPASQPQFLSFYERNRNRLCCSRR